MFNLFDMMQRSQDGSAVENMARQFGLTPRQAENAVDVLLPAFALALQRNMQDPKLWPNLVAAVQPPPAPPSTPFEAASRAFTPDGMRQGAEFMANLFGSPDLSKHIAAQGAAASGLPATMLQQMLPAISAMLMSGMLKTFSQQGLAGVMEAMNRTMSTAQVGASMASMPGFNPAAQAQAMAPFLEMFGRMMPGAASAEPPPAPEPEPPAPEPEEVVDEPAKTPTFFDPAVMTAFFSQMMTGFAPQAAPPEGETSGESDSAGDSKHAPGKTEAKPSAAPGRPAKAVGAKPAAAASPAKPAAPAPGAVADSEPEEQNAGGQSPFEAMVQTGREVQEQHLRNLQALFAQMFPDGGKGRERLSGDEFMTAVEFWGFTARA